MTWHYRTDTKTASGSNREQLTIRTLAFQRLDDERYGVRRTSDDTDYLIGVDNTGIYRIAKRRLVDTTPQRDPERRYVLKKPYQIGTTWSHSTAIFLIQRWRPGTVNDFYPINEKPVEMTYQIEAVEQTIEVRAGRFEHCILVRGTTDITIFVDPDQGFVEVPITNRETYCPGVGLVLLERYEEVTSRFYQGGTFKLELVDYNSG
jgi:hypothetical protein